MTLWVGGLFLSITIPALLLMIITLRRVLYVVAANIFIFIILLSLAGLMPFQKIPQQTQIKLEQIAQKQRNNKPLNDALEDGTITLWEYQSIDTKKGSSK